MQPTKWNMTPDHLAVVIERTDGSFVAKRITQWSADEGYTWDQEHVICSANPGRLHDLNSELDRWGFKVVSAFIKS